MTWFLGILLSYAVLARIARCDDIAFIDVSMDGSMDMRFLDFRVPTKAGIAGFFQESVMLPHDWLDTRKMTATIEAVTNATTVASSDIAKQVKQLKTDLSPLFRSLPKLEGSRGVALADGPARYAIHRYFRRAHGWSLKGLEPAGFSLLPANMSQKLGRARLILSYLLPAFLFQVVRDAATHKGIELSHLAIIIVTILRLELIDFQRKLFSVFRTLQLPVAGEKTKEEIAFIIDAFLLAYVFGMNLEISSKRAVEDARGFLANGNSAWPKLRSFVEELMQASATPVFDFYGVLRFLSENFARSEYPKWLNRDCKIAKSSLAASPHIDKGRLPLEHLPRQEADIRPLFSEKDEDLRELGVLEDSADDHMPSEKVPRLLVANYVLSQALCLPTASLHTICCHNECEDVMERVEGKVMAPSAKPEEVLAAMSDASPAIRATGPDVESLRAQASDPSDGLVRLHGRPFAAWLHTVLPLVCPAPGRTAQLGPKTPDEWMQDPNGDAEELVKVEVAHDSAISAFTTMGSKPGSRDEQPTDRQLEVFPVTAAYPDPAAVIEPEWFGGEHHNVIIWRVWRFVLFGTVLWATTAITLLGPMREWARGSQHVNVAKVSCV